MFKRDVKTLDEILKRLLRSEGFETPLLQKRLMDSWDSVVGSSIAKYTGEKFIKNQTLFVKILNPALRQDLSMMRSKIVKHLNDNVGAMIISDIKFF